MTIFSLRYKHSISIELKNRARNLKEHPNISEFTKFDGYWFKPKGMVHLERGGGGGGRPLTRGEGRNCALTKTSYYIWSVSTIFVHDCKHSYF